MQGFEKSQKKVRAQVTSQLAISQKIVHFFWLHRRISRAIISVYRDAVREGRLNTNADRELPSNSNSLMSTQLGRVLHNIKQRTLA